MQALETKKPIVVWLEFQDCAADTEAFLRASNPSVAQILLEMISLDYHETIMAAAGHQAEELLAQTVAERWGLSDRRRGGHSHQGKRHLLLHRRPDGGGYRQGGGGQFGAVMAVGACATWGGWPSSQPNPTGARGVGDVVSGVPIINLTGCPHNVVNSVATIVHYLTFGSLPDTDHLGRPLFAYGKRIHDNCERRGHFDAGQYVEAGATRPCQGLVPVQDGLQGSRDLYELPDGAL